MQRGSARTLDESERRRVGAMMVASAQGSLPGGRATPSSSRHGGNREARGRDQARRRKGRADLGRHLVPLLLELPGKVGFRTAFCAAVAAWSLALVLSLGCFEVVRW